MNSDGGVNELMLLRDLNRAIERAGTVASAHGEEIRNFSLSRAGDDLLAIRVKARAIEVAVRVYEHDRVSFRRASLGSTRDVTVPTWTLLLP